MDISAIFPTCEIGSDVGAIREWVVAAEDLGYSRVVCFDHVLGASRADREPPLWGPYDDSFPFHEPMTLFSYLAGITHNISFMTGVLVLPQRQTALVAKQAAELSILSENRLTLAVAVGWNPVEYQALGVPFTSRGARLNEQIELLRKLLTEPLVDYTGRFHRIERAGISPIPSRPVPIWIGGYAEQAWRRAADLGDGFALSPAPGDIARQQVQGLRRQLLERGHDPSSFPIELGCLWCDGPDHVNEAASLARELELSSLAVNTMSGTARWRDKRDIITLNSPAEHIAALEDFARQFAR